MDDIVKLVQSKTGLSEDQARSAVDTVVGFIKDKLPPQISSQIDNVVSGDSNIAKGLGGMIR